MSNFLSYLLFNSMLGSWILIKLSADQMNWFAESKRGRWHVGLANGIGFVLCK